MNFEKVEKIGWWCLMKKRMDSLQTQRKIVNNVKLKGNNLQNL